MIIFMLWRETPDRVRSFRNAMDFWSMLGEVRLVDSGHTNFHRAASRNLAVMTAANLGHTKLVITDADTIPEAGPVKEAWSSVDDDAVHLPYSLCRVLDRSDRVVGEFGFTCGGVYVTTVNAWTAVGGQDEGFTAWAPEDMAFKLAHNTLLGPMVRHEGVLLSLGHDQDPNRHTDAEDDPMVQLYRKYEHANGHPDLMRALCFPS